MSATGCKIFSLLALGEDNLYINIMSETVFAEYTENVLLLTAEQQAELLAVLLGVMSNRKNFAMKGNAALLKEFSGCIDADSMNVRESMNEYLDERYGV